jgi:hypothetical protein
MDETTLTRTLRDLAANPTLHTAPAADARHRALRLQRRRRTEAGALALVAIVATAAVVRPWGGSAGPSTTASGGDAALTRLIHDPENPNHATTDYALLPTGGGREVALYWQHDQLCLQTVGGAASASRSECSSFVRDAARPLTVANIGEREGVMVLTLGKNVTRVRIARPDGSHTDLAPVTADGFPQDAALVTGKVASATAYNADGAQLGAKVIGPDAPQLTIQQVQQALPCAGQPPVAGQVKSADGAECYVLEHAALTIHPKAAEAQYDSTQGYLVQVSLNEQDRIAFGALTTRVVPLAAPLNQLAIVLNGVVLSAPTVQTAIDGGFFQITGGATPFSKADVDKLTAELSP